MSDVDDVKRPVVLKHIHRVVQGAWQPSTGRRAVLPEIESDNRQRIRAEDLVIGEMDVKLIAGDGKVIDARAAAQCRDVLFQRGTARFLVVDIRVALKE